MNDKERQLLIEMAKSIEILLEGYHGRVRDGQATALRSATNVLEEVLQSPSEPALPPAE